MANKKMDTIFKKNLLTISILIIVLNVISIMVFISTNISVSNSQIALVEIQEIERVKTAFEYTVDQIAASSAYLSTLTLSTGTDNIIIDYYSNLAIKKQINILLSTNNSIGEIRIVNEKNNISIDTKKDKDHVFDESLCYGILDGAYLYGANAGTVYNLCLKIPTEEGGYNYNTVYMTIDSLGLSKAVMYSENPSRSEYIVDNNGTVIVSLKSSNIGKNINDIYQSDLYNGNKYKAKAKIEGQKYTITTEKLSSFDLNIVSIANNSLYADIHFKNTLNALLLGAMLIISTLIIAYVIIFTTYKPIRNIMDRVGGYMPILKTDNINEVNYINEKFDILKSTNSELSKTVEEKIKELRIQQMVALQTQICPHFTYNTLDALNWIAYKNLKTRKNEISVAVKDMAEIFRSCLDLNGLFRTIREEIEITKTYIKILDIRFGNAFAVTWNVDEDLLDSMILKLCVQPLIENVATHAFEGDFKNAQIEISIIKDSENIVVSVKDNGVGMDKEKLNKVREQISDFSTESVEHIGLKNVNHRICLMYGDTCGLVIKSEVGKGTICCFSYTID